jgi:hypothetical protein
MTRKDALKVMERENVELAEIRKKNSSVYGAKNDVEEDPLLK